MEKTPAKSMQDIRFCPGTLITSIDLSFLSTSYVGMMKASDKMFSSGSDDAIRGSSGGRSSDTQVKIVLIISERSDCLPLRCYLQGGNHAHALLFRLTKRVIRIVIINEYVAGQIIPKVTETHYRVN